MTETTRHLLDIDCLSEADTDRLLNRACALARGAEPEPCRHVVANLFLEPSTRTRVSFEVAAGRLGMQVVNIGLAGSSASKGESIDDTLATLTAMGVGCVVLRQSENGRCRQLVDSLDGDLRLINAGEGTRAHPSQALLDAATLKANGKAFSGLRIAIVGDILHSRVAASGVSLWRRLGVAEIRLAGPAEWMPSEPGGGVVSCDSLEDAVVDADVIMMLRVQRERMDESGRPDPEAYFRQWGLKPAHLERAHPDCVVMHPGPINRGIEIDPRVADGPRSLIREQVRMGVFTRMAIFEWLMEQGSR